MMKRRFQDDLQYGLARENAVMLKLRTHFNDETIKNTKDIHNDEYCGWDYESLEGLKMEVKSRRCCLRQYPTTIIPIHKAQETGTIFCFNFTDGLYYIVYDPAVFSAFGQRYVSVNREGRRDLPTLHWEIPIELLIRIEA
jgi:hypothetical protein